MDTLMTHRVTMNIPTTRLKLAVIVETTMKTIETAVMAIRITINKNSGGTISSSSSRKTGMTCGRAMAESVHISIANGPFVFVFFLSLYWDLGLSCSVDGREGGVS